MRIKIVVVLKLNIHTFSEQYLAQSKKLKNTTSNYYNFGLWEDNGRRKRQMRKTSFSMKISFIAHYVLCYMEIILSLGPSQWQVMILTFFKFDGENEMRH